MEMDTQADDRLCPYCGLDAYHYEDVGTGIPARVAINCCARMVEESAAAAKRNPMVDLVERETMSDWQPIETAPKDRTNVLVCVTHNTPDGGWETIQWVDWQSERYIWPIFRERIDIPFAPTHWMPLPAPPRE